MYAVLAAFLAFGLVSASIAAGSAKLVDAPDVMVMILSVTPPYDQVSIQYNSVLSSDATNADLSALARDTGWLFENAESSTQSAGTPGSVPTTSTNFIMLRIANYTEGLLPLSPFVDTFKRFKRIEIRYLVTKDYKFRGLRDYENQYVKIDMSHQGSSYLYRVQVKDRGFDKIQIPLKPTPKPVAGRAVPKAFEIVVRILLIFGVAAIGAVLAYLLTSFVAKRRAGNDNVET